MCVLYSVIHSSLSKVLLTPYQVRRRKWLVKHVNEDLCPVRGYISPWGGTEVGGGGEVLLKLWVWRKGLFRKDSTHTFVCTAVLLLDWCCSLLWGEDSQERRTTLHVCSQRDDESTKAFILRVLKSLKNELVHFKTNFPYFYCCFTMSS